MAGDPTVFGNLPVPEAAETAIVQALKTRSYNGYGASVGQCSTHTHIYTYMHTDDFIISILRN